MRYILFILFPFILLGQNLTGSDAIYFNGAAADKVYLNGSEVWSATAPEIYTFANAANPTETNATTGFTSEINVSFSSVSSSPSPQDGTYSILMEHTGGTNSAVRGITSFTTDGSSTYEIKLYLNEVNGTNWTFGVHTTDGWTASQNFNVTSVGIWTEYTITGTVNSGTADIRFEGSTSSDGGNQLGIDNIRITKL